MKNAYASAAAPAGGSQCAADVFSACLRSVPVLHPLRPGDRGDASGARLRPRMEARRREENARCLRGCSAQPAGEICEDWLSEMRMPEPQLTLGQCCQLDWWRVIRSCRPHGKLTMSSSVDAGAGLPIPAVDLGAELLSEKSTRRGSVPARRGRAASF